MALKSSDTKVLVDGGATASNSAPSIWAMIAVDCLSFAIFFMVFMTERMKAPEAFDASARQLSVGIGLTNTLILISSSWLVALAVLAAQRADLATVRRLLPLAIVLASGFGGLKLFEYASKIAHDITPLSSEFFSYYFALTGLHFLHYFIGMGVLIWMLVRTRRVADGDYASYLNLMVSGGIFWHMVDLLWVFLFPMLYLLGAH